jgi:uncharacterized phage protein (TIGR01671 family)
MSSRKNLKFRVWDVQNNKTLSWDDVWYSVCHIPPNTILGQDKQESLPFFSVASQAPDTKYIVDQFSGLQDRVGLEVYDNDIVKDLIGKTYRIKWQAPSFYLVAKYPNTEQTEKMHFISPPKFKTEFTVIGNIHQNPELYISSPSI